DMRKIGIGDLVCGLLRPCMDSNGWTAVEGVRRCESGGIADAGHGSRLGRDPSGNGRAWLCQRGLEIQWKQEGSIADGAPRRCATLKDVLKQMRRAPARILSIYVGICLEHSHSVA